MLNNSTCAWLTNYLNHVQMTHRIYFLGIALPFINFHITRNFLIGVCYIRVAISNKFVHVSMGRSVLMYKLSGGVDRGGALL